ncbi:glucosamine-6-phosphate deaminase [Ancrocorticia populi]|uniref:Glucosamine-6-phosphate deaminase n=1 Tax=Ancrocorticia populi TaxID=2175228 RepID=A0A2V1KDJ9_9ACTO|nr:glucosamine-6-phosphate deaminase [Ancrocorticia populi]PWF27567.1 glucosamine-6-phosphate deaminase [Ancrocorticia populi]
MDIGIFHTSDEAARAAAQIVIEKPHSTLGVATGSTPLGLYAELRKAWQDGRFSASSAYALDEYVGIDADHPEGYRNVLRRELLGQTGLTGETLHTPDGNAEDPVAAAAAYDFAIGAAGVDLQILGLGSDGHIGFNEPGGSLVSRTHVEVLASTTRHDNARFFGNDPEAVPATCITQGLGTIMEAKVLLLLAFGAGKAEAVTHLVEGAVSAAWPCTIMQMHPEVYVLTDEEAAVGLEHADLYRERWSALHSERRA